MANVDVKKISKVVALLKFVAAKVVAVASWVKAKLTVLFGWVADLWTDVHGQADVRVIGADICIGAEIILVLEFLKKIETINIAGGLFYLALIAIVGFIGYKLLKIAKDALDKK